MKTHLSTTSGTACRRKVVAGTRTTASARQVSCLTCKATTFYREAKAWEDAERHTAFMAQEPRECSAQFGGKVTCSSCAGTLFRIGDRSCYGHYENYICANPECGHTESRLTETGMCF